MSNILNNKLLKLLNNIKVIQHYNKNQFVIKADDFMIFQSYDSIIALYDKNNRVLYLGCDWNYSNTTRKHLYLFIYDYVASSCGVSMYDIYASNNKSKLIKKYIDEGTIKYKKNLLQED